MPSGRLTKLTDEVQGKIVNAIRAGNYIETAAAYAGVNKTSIYEWLKRGAREQERVERTPRARLLKGEEKFVAFSNAVQKALADAEVRDVAIIGKAAESEWTAAAWRLERKFPGRWGRKDRNAVEISGKVEVQGHAAERIINDRDASDLAHRLLERLASDESGGDGL